MPNLKAIEAFVSAMQTATLRHMDFEQSLVDARAGDFVYLDPPYFTSRPTFGEYGYGSFTYSDLGRLIAVLRSLDERGVKFLLSYSAPSSSLQALDNYFRRFVTTRRTIGAQASNRGDVHEWLVANYAAVSVNHEW